MTRNPFTPDPSNGYHTWATSELEIARDTWNLTENTHPVAEELNRREDVDTAVALWERLCEVPFVRGETQGYYSSSTRNLMPDTSDHSGSVKRMPDTAEIEALILSDGEETAYPPHDAQPAYDPSIPDLTDEQRAETYYHEPTNPWSGDDLLYPITLELISCGDYHGSDLDAANNRALDGTPGVDVSEPNTGGMGSVFNVSTTIVGAMTSFENSQTPADWEREPATRRADALMWLTSLVEQMEGLIDYALLDEAVHSEFVDELAEEAWSDHLESDTFDALLDFASSHATDDRDYAEVLDAMRVEEPNRVHAAYFDCEENEWNVHSLSEGATNGRHEEAVKHVARTLFCWNV